MDEKGQGRLYEILIFEEPVIECINRRTKTHLGHILNILDAVFLAFPNSDYHKQKLRSTILDEVNEMQRYFIEILSRLESKDG